MAKKRAERLLLRHLDRQQRELYVAERRFYVDTPDGRRYEITAAHAHNVFIVEGDERVMEMCVVPRQSGCPIPDVMLAQKLYAI